MKELNMKKKLFLAIMLIVFSVVVFGIVSVSAATTTLNVSYLVGLQSSHPYSNGMDKTWVYTHSTSADSLEITFSNDTETEAKYDYIYIFDGSSNQIGKYDGTTWHFKTSKNKNPSQI